MSSAILTAITAVALTSSPRIHLDETAAIADQQQFPVETRWRYYYITTAAGHPTFDQARQATAMKFVIPSCSRQVNLDKCVPTQVGPTLYRIDLANLQWDHAAWLRFVKDYPYSRHENPIMVRADWLCVHLMDANEQASPAYYELLFGKVPKTRDEALQILGVNQDESLQFGYIEGNSGVSVAGVRWIANLPVNRGYAWGTRDVFELNLENDMLERPDGSFKHDGEEWIIGILKKGRLPNGNYVHGALQVYLLTDGVGNIIQRADVRLVEDHTRFRGLSEIRIGGSCMQCHTSGLNGPTKDDFRGALESGIYATSDYLTKEKIENFHFTDMAKEIRRNNEDFSTIVELACGCKSEEAAAAFKSVVNVYDLPVSPARAAWELGIEKDELRLALGLASSVGAKLPARIAGLAHKRYAPRVAFEPAYVDLNYGIIPSWRGKQ